ncbi:MAG: HEAT repeat domain-containing protein [Planctomycetota bacterium]
MTQVSPSAKSNPKVRFGSRDLFVLILIVALACAWWIDHTRLNKNIELLELRLAQSRQQFTASFAAASPARNAVSPAELLQMVANDSDWYALQDELARFRNSKSRDEAVPGLIELLQTQDPQVRTRALSALSQMESKADEVVTAVIPLLETDDANIRWHAINTLGKIGADSPEVAALLTAEMNDDLSELASHAALTLKALDPAVDIGSRLIKLAQNPMAQNRSRAIQRLADYAKPADAIPVLKKIYQRETDDEIKVLIASALNQLEQ